MYRATAEAVSGTRVYADGKWLRCIGNKRVSVGDRIWTDGRCVYGYFQESQQPQVITAQEEEEGIPIVISMAGKKYRLMTFQENKLKDVAEVRYEDGKLNLYKCIAGEFVFSSELEIKVDKWTNFILMINDYRKTSFLYDEGTHHKPLYNGTNDSFVSDTKLIASNIDKFGNRFDMVVRYEIELISENLIQPLRNINQKSVDILQNGKVIKSVSLQSMIDDVESACPNTEARWVITQWLIPPVATEGLNGSPNAYSTSINWNLGLTTLEETPGAFIENEKSWAFWFTCYCVKETLFNPYSGIQGDEAIISEIPGALTVTSLFRHYLVTATGKSIVLAGAGKTKTYLKDGEDTGDTYIHDDRYSTQFTLSKEERITIPLQDGYRYEAYDFFCQQDMDGLSYSDYPVASNDPLFAFMTFYTQKNEELFTGVFPLNAKFLICKISGGHLFYVSNSMKNPFLFGEDFDSYKKVPALDKGFYLIKNGKCTPIDTSATSVINQRLRSMKKIRGWQNRLQTIEIEQEEI